MAPLRFVLAGGLAAAMFFNICEAFAPLCQNGVTTTRSFGVSGNLGLRAAPSCRTRTRSTPRSVAAAPRMETQPKVSATEQFWTRPRTTNANWGIFFEIVAKDRPIWITGIHAGGHSFAAHDDYTRLKVRVLSAEGSAVGKELNEKAWTPVGEVLKNRADFQRGVASDLPCSRQIISSFPAWKLAKLPPNTLPCLSRRFTFLQTPEGRSASTRIARPAWL